MIEGQSRFEKTVLRTSILFHWVTDANQALLPGVSPILKIALGLSYFQLGTLFGSFLLAMVFFQIIVGRLADRFNETDLMAVGTFLVFLSCIGFAFSSTYSHLFIANTVAGIGASFYHPSAYTVLSRASYPKIRKFQKEKFHARPRYPPRYQPR